MSDSSAGEAGRRAYDRLEPIVEVYVEKTVQSTRHALRNEFTAEAVKLHNKIDALTKAVSDANVQSVREHAEVQACIEEVRKDVAELKELVPKVATLERHDAVDEARSETQEKILKRVEEGRRWLIMACVAVVGVALTALTIVLSVVL